MSATMRSLSSARGGMIALFLALGCLLQTSAGASATAIQCGKASWYNLTSRTASGEFANPNTMTAAHRTLPFGSEVLVTNLHNGNSVTVRINDRGPFVKGRIIDVTQLAAQKLGFMNRGVAQVSVLPLDGNPISTTPDCSAKK